MAVIELAKPGLEATTYELIITAGNAGAMVRSIVATQLLYPMKAVGCEDDSGRCSRSSSVVVTNAQSFVATDGPARFTHYCLALFAISVAACLIFTPFLPGSIEECHEWREKGVRIGQSTQRAYFALAICAVSVLVRRRLIRCPSLLVDLTGPLRVAMLLLSAVRLLCGHPTAHPQHLLLARHRGLRLLRLR
jgi:hypothetical protein